MDKTQRQELEKLLNNELDDLYTMLVSKKDLTVYSKRGALSKGKELFSRVLPQIKGDICSFYRQTPTTSSNLIDYAILLASSISNTIVFGNVPVFPLTAIILKIGLEEICRGDK